MIYKIEMVVLEMVSTRHTVYVDSEDAKAANLDIIPFAKDAVRGGKAHLREELSTHLRPGDIIKIEVVE